MASRKKTYHENKVATIIGRGTVVTGDIHSKGTIRVEGEVTGRIVCDDTIVVYESGKVEADLVAGQVIVSGKVKGDIFAHDRFEVTNKGMIIGNVTAPKVAIAEGVVFEGRCTMKPPGEAKPPKLDRRAGNEAAPLEANS